VLSSACPQGGDPLSVSRDAFRLSPASRYCLKGKIPARGPTTERPVRTRATPSSGVGKRICLVRFRRYPTMARQLRTMKERNTVNETICRVSMGACRRGSIARTET
jgi:hypothetical protein